MSSRSITIKEGRMKRYLSITPVVLLLCLGFGCKQSTKEQRPTEERQPTDAGMASAIKDAFRLGEDDKLTVLESSLESQDVALVKFSLNGERVSSKIKKAESAWKLSEIQNIEDEWTPASDFLMIKGRFVDESGKGLPEKTVTLIEVDDKGKGLTMRIRTGKGGRVLVATTETDSGGNFTLIADRRLWERSGYFSLTLHVGGERWAYLGRGELKNVPAMITVHKDAKRFDLGEVKVPR
jgi:hypothetical protein